MGIALLLSPLTPAATVAVAPAAVRAGPSGCAGTVAARPDFGAPTSKLAWRALVYTPAAVYLRPGGARPAPARRSLLRADAPWLLVVGRPHAAHGRCFVPLRLPWRPNGAAGWVDIDSLSLVKTSWRIVVSRDRRTLTLDRGGSAVRTVRVVVGKPRTPTPPGLFAIAWAVKWHPDAFLGSWVLTLTAHSDALQRFDGGDGTVAIHGRGSASLTAPLGSAASHGCLRLANRSIDWLVRTIGSGQIQGTPVQIL